MRAAALLVAFAIALGASAQAAPRPSCPLPAQKPMLVAQLFFGLSVKGRGPVTPREWRRFADRVLTPHFPDGFTVYDGKGEWRNGSAGPIIREDSKVLLVAGPDDAEFRAAITAVADAYKQEFGQLSVGVLTEPGCGAF